MAKKNTTYTIPDNNPLSIENVSNKELDQSYTNLLDIQDPSGETGIHSLATVIEDDLRLKVVYFRDKGYDNSRIASLLQIPKLQIDGIK